MSDIKKAVILVAGYGTRFLPVTKAQPKEMLPLVDKPIVQYLVEEAVHAGLKEIILVTGKNKRAIEDHFDRAPELESFLESKGKDDLARIVKEASSLGLFFYVRQKEPLGSGDAVLQAWPLTNNEPVAVLSGDDIIDAHPSALAQLIRVYEKYGAPVVAPVTKTELAKITCLPSSLDFSRVSGAQCPVSAAPDTQILYFKCMCDFIFLM